jgi:hypothetical protein
VYLTYLFNRKSQLAHWKWCLNFCVFPYTRKVFSVRFLALFCKIINYMSNSCEATFVYLEHSLFFLKFKKYFFSLNFTRLFIKYNFPGSRMRKYKQFCAGILPEWNRFSLQYILITFIFNCSYMCFLYFLKDEIFMNIIRYKIVLQKKC